VRGRRKGSEVSTDVSRDRPLALSSSQVITKRTPADYAEALTVAQGGFPGRAGDPVRAGQRAGLPVDVEVLFRETRPLGGLRVGTDRTEQGDVPVLGCLVDAVWGDVAAVDDVLERLKALAVQALMDVIEGIDVLLRSGAGDHLNNDMRTRLVTGLGLVIAIADPVTLAGCSDFLAVAGLGIMRGDDLHRRPRHPCGGGSGRPSADDLPVFLCPVALRLARSRVDFAARHRS
jgi:hypothetical protein